MSKERLRLGLALVLFTGAILAQAAAAQAPPPGVFSELQTAVVPAVSRALEPATVRSRVVQVDTQKIAAARRGRETLKLNLFDDEIVEVRIKRVRPTRNGYFISGTPGGKEWGDVRLVVNGPIMVGTVITPEGEYTIRSAGAGRHVVRQVDPSRKSIECEVDETPLPDHSSLPAISSIDPLVGGAISAQQPQAQDVPTEDGSEIRVLVVYTPRLQADQGGSAGMQAGIDLLMQSTNQAFEESGIRTRLVLAHAALVDFDEESLPSMGAVIRVLKDHDDGHLDEVHLLRNKYAADLVHLLVDRLGGGLASRPLSESLSNEESAAFSITAGITEDVFAHETGHTFGLRHDRFLDRGAVYPYAHGYVNKSAFLPGAPSSARWRTIMASSYRCGQGGFSCTGLLRFSNPDQAYLGDPLGVPADSLVTGKDGPADARLTINNMARWVGSYRSEACTEFALSKDELVTPVDGGEITVRVNTAPGCLWQASSQTGFLAIATDMPAAGPGLVTVEVSRNETGTDRNGRLTIAGHVVSVRQLATDAGICGRSFAVAENISMALGHTGIGECAEVADTDLASLESLDLRDHGIGLLKAGDFDGLSRLRSLNLESNQLTELPSDLFFGLNNLEDLMLGNNRLAQLPADVFAGLSNLQILDLQENQLGSLPVPIFDSLSKLRELFLASNRLANLPESLFEGLSQVEEIYLERNKLSALPNGLFAGLARLEYLRLRENRLTDFNASLFTDLSRLRTLNLVQNRLTRVPDNLPASLRELWLNYNEITSVPEDAFAGLSNLETLGLSGNHIVRLPLDAFSTLVNLRNLSLGDNRLREIPPSLFDGLIGLTSLHLDRSDITDLQSEVFQGLTALENLNLIKNRLNTLPAGFFSQLPTLRKLHLSDNQFSSFPDKVFSDATNLRTLDVSRNPGVPIPLQLSIEVLQDNLIRAVARTGAPFTINLPVAVSDAGSIDAEVGTIAIPAGATESEPLAVRRVEGTQEAVSVDFGTLPELPRDHFGYVLKRDEGLPLRILPSLLPTDAMLIDLTVKEGVLAPSFAADIESYALIVANELSMITLTHETSNAKATVAFYDGSDSDLADADSAIDGHQVKLAVGDNTIRIVVTAEDATATQSYKLVVTRDKPENVCIRTPQVRDAIVEAVGVVDACSEVSASQLSQVLHLNLRSSSLESLKSGDFSGMTGLKMLDLDRNFLTNLPSDLFSGLDKLESLDLHTNLISELPEDLFSGLTSLRSLSVGRNALRELPPAIFSDLSGLQSLTLHINKLRILPHGIFSDLSALQRLDLGSNSLTSLASSAFSGLTKLTHLELFSNRIESLPADVFSDLESLGKLRLSGNALGILQTSTFSGLPQLWSLDLGRNHLKQVPAGFFSELSALARLHLDHNQIPSLPTDVFSGLSRLVVLDLEGNLLNNLPDGLFSGLTGFNELELRGNAVDLLPLTVSVAKTKDGEFKVVAPTGAPFGLSIEIDISAAGTTDDDVRVIRIPAGLAQSEPVSLTRVEGTTAAVTVDISLVPTLPDKHFGYFIERDKTLPKAILPGLKDSTPAQVMNVQVAPGPEQLEVTWDSVPDAGGYKVQWKSGEEDYGESRQAVVSGGDTVSYAIAELAAGEEHTVRVIATRENADDGSPSAEVIGTPEPRNAGQVTDLALTVGVGQLEVSWAPIPEANGYKVQWKSGDEDFDESRQVELSGGDIVTHTITDLTAGTEYTIRVIATKTDVEDSAPSEEVTGVPKAESPAQVTGVAVAAGIEQLDVSWSSLPEANGYQVQWKSGDEEFDESRQAVVSGGETVSYTITGLTAGTAYAVRVIATRQDADAGVPSDEVSGVPEAEPPAQVTGVAVTPGLEELDVSWDAVPEADGYKVQWKSGDQDYSQDRQVALLGAETTSYTIIDLTVDTEYTVRVIATKSHADDGPPSEEVTATPAAPDPDVNTDGMLDGDDAQVMYQAYASEERVGDGESGGTAESRRTLLSGLAGVSNPSDDDLRAMLRKAHVWKVVGLVHGGDINEDGVIDGDDAFVMYYAYEFADLVGDGETGGTARHRQHLLASRSNKDDPTDEDLKAMLKRANKLLEDFG